MTLPELYQRIATLPSGGMLSDENRFDYGFVYSLIHTASAQAKRAEFMRTKKPHPAWFFPYYPDFNSLAQIDGCFYRFKIPQIIALDARQTGVEYAGSIRANEQFNVVIGRAKFAAMQKDRVMKSGIGNTVLIDNGFCEVYGKAKNFFINAAWFDVTQLSNFSLEKDDYNIEASLIPEVERIILQLNLNIITKSAIDYLQNKKDDSAVAAK